MRERGEKLRDAPPIAWCGCGVRCKYALYYSYVFDDRKLGQGCGPGTGLTGQARLTTLVNQQRESRAR